MSYSPGFIPDGLENSPTPEQRRVEQRRQFTRTQIADPGVSAIPSMYQPRQKHDRKTYEGRVHAAIRRMLVEYEGGRDVPHDEIARAAQSFLAFMDTLGS